MGEMEQILRVSGTEWTAIRPAWLSDGPATGLATVTSETPASGLYRTNRGDLARFMVDCADTGTWMRRAPAIAGPNT